MPLPIRLLLLAVLPPALAATAGSSPIADEIEVRLVTVEVGVTDGAGRTVTWLAQESFEILLDGRPVTIATFEPARETSASAAPAPSDRRPRSLAIYVDFGFLPPGRIAAILPQLRRFAIAELGPEDRLALFAADGSLRLEQELTGDRDLVLARLAEIAPRLGSRRSQVEYREILREMEKTIGSGGLQAGGIRDALPDLLLDRISLLAQETAQEIEQSARLLRRAVIAMAGLPGRREILYVGGPPPITAAADLFETWRGAFGPTSAFAEIGGEDEGGTGAGTDREEGLTLGLGSFGNLESPVTVADPDTLFAPVFAAARRERVPIHTLEVSDGGSAAAALTTRTGGAVTLPGGISGLSTRLDPGQTIEDRSSLGRLATRSRGLRLRGGRGLESDLTALARAPGANYILGFADGGDGTGEEHRIEVRLRGAGDDLELRYADTYLSRSADRAAAAAMRSALLLGHADNRLDVQLEAGAPIGESARQRRLPLRVQVPVANLALAAQRRTHSARLSIFSTAADRDGEPSPVHKAILPLTIDNRELLTSLGRNVEYAFELELPPGADRVAVGVRDDFAQIMATLVLPLGTGATLPRPDPSS